MSAICGQCHGREAALFRASAKRDLFDALDVPECSGCHGHHEIDHPSPALFHRESEPVVEPGRIISRDPLVAEVEALARGAEARVGWTSVLRPQLDLDDERLQHVVEIRVGEQEPLVLDASVGPDLEPGPRRVDGAGVAAELTIESTSGGEVQQGDTVRFTLVLRGEADAVAGPIEVNDRPGSGIDSIEGSICLTCHEPGDDCDQATERMHAALKALDREIREAEALLSSAEHAGMEVRDAQFELSSAGRTATIESRALIHSFEPGRLIQRTEEGQGVAAQALAAAKAALEELRRRQVGLAISLVVILLVLVGLYLKIRQVDRERHSA